MIKSMTAFAQKEETRNGVTVATEIRSYNSRHLDVVLRVSHGYQALEERIKTEVNARFERGRLEVGVRIQDRTEADTAFEVDLERAVAYRDTLAALQARLQLETPVTLDMIVNAPGVIRAAEVERNPEAIWPVVQVCLAASLDDLDAMRQREGAFIAQDFGERLDLLETLAAEIERQADGLVGQYQERLRERIAVLTGESVVLDAQRIAQEAALMADRSDISEELVRVKSHLAQYRLIMRATEPAGRKLNFLLQEFNREFNTMGAKAGKAEIAYLIVNAKAEIEKLREQVQNVE